MPIADDSITTAMLQDGCVTVAKCNTGVRCKTVNTVTSTQLCNDLVAGIVLVPAPGANKIIFPLFCIVRYTYGVDAHIGLNTNVGYLGDNINAIFTSMSSFDGSSSKTTVYRLAASSINVLSSSTNLINCGLYLRASFNSAATSATGTAGVEIHYFIGDA